MKISASRISSTLKEYNMENLLLKFKKNLVLENPYYISFIQTEKLHTHSHWEKIQKTNLYKINKIRRDESPDWVLSGKQKDHQIFTQRGFHKENW